MSRRTLKVALWILFLGVIGPGGAVPSFAQEEGDETEMGVILFSAQGIDPAHSSRLGEQLRRTMRLAKKAGLRIPGVADLDQKNDGMLVVEGEQHLVDARRYYGRGVQLLFEGRRSEAFEEFERALHFYRSAYPYAQDEQFYRDIFFYIGETGQTTKGKTKREKDFLRCEAIGMALELTGDLAVLELVNPHYPECEWKIEDPESRELEVSTNPTGARVYVDGQYRGVTPTKLTNLRAGEHVFTFVREGYRRVSRILRIGEKFQETRELEMGLHLKPGVYQSIYKELVPVVQGSAKDEQAILAKAADTLQVKGVLLVLTVPSTEQKTKVFTTLWEGAGKSAQRKEFDVEITSRDKIEEAVIKIISGVFGASATDLPSLAERAPIYFKLELPPFSVEEE